MTYRLTCLTPLLVGDGTRLSPIDTMVWRDALTVLDQERIFKLLSRGPRLEPYLQQLRKVDRLEFAQWGGFAQSYSRRRIPFADPAAVAAWQQSPPAHLFVPTFLRGPRGPYLPASALKGALRTALAAQRFTDEAAQALLGKAPAGRPLRKPGTTLEEATLGPAVLRGVGGADSDPVAETTLQLYLIRVATLVGQPSAAAAGWKHSARGSVGIDRPDLAAAQFAEMAAPGTSFEGRWGLQAKGKGPVPLHRLLQAANEHAGNILALQRAHAERLRLGAVAAEMTRLEQELSEVRERQGQCLLCLGWGAGVVSKLARQDAGPWRELLAQHPPVQDALRTGLPFPKTRKVVFEGQGRLTLPGWARLEVGG